MDKKWYQSKAIWGALIVLTGAILGSLGFPQYDELIIGIGASLGLIGIRTAVK